MKNKKYNFIKKLSIFTLSLTPILCLPIFASIFNHTNIENNINKPEIVSTESYAGNSDQVEDKVNGITYVREKYNISPIMSSVGYIEPSWYTRPIKVEGYRAIVNDKSRSNYNLKPIINNLPLISLNSTFKGCTSLTTFPSIPDTVLDMSSAFEGCTSLNTTSSVLPGNVVDITNAFKGCTSLEISTVDIPNSVQKFAGAFANIKSIGTANLKATVNPKDPLGTTMMNAFSNVNNIKSVVIFDPFVYFKKSILGIQNADISVSRSFNSEINFWEKSIISSLYNVDASAIYENLLTLPKRNAIPRFMRLTGIITSQISITESDTSGKIISCQPTIFNFRNVKPSYKTGTISFTIEYTNYFENNVYYAQTKSINCTISGLKPVNGPTEAIANPDIDFTQILPTDINRNNINGYFTLTNLPVNSNYEVKDIVALNYISGGAGQPPSAKIIVTFTAHQSYVVVGNDLDILEEPKDFSITMTNMKYQLPTTISNNLIYQPPAGQNNIYPSQATEGDIISTLNIQNEPYDAEVLYDITNKSTMDTDGKIVLNLWLSKYYDVNGILRINPNFGNKNISDAFKTGIEITGFNRITGATQLSPNPSMDLIGQYACNVVNQINADNYRNYINVNNLPIGSKLTYFQITDWSNTAGTVDISLTFSSAIINDSTRGYVIKENYPMTYKITGLTKITNTTSVSVDLNSIPRRYPSQITSSDIIPLVNIQNKSPIQKLITPSGQINAETTFSITDLVPDDKYGTLTFNLKIKNALIVDPSNPSNIIVNINESVYSYKVNNLPNIPGSTFIQAKTLEPGMSIPPITNIQSQFYDYFNVVNMPEGAIINVLQLNYDPSSGEISTQVSISKVFENGKIVERPKTFNAINVIAPQTNIYEDNWTNGTNWTWAIIGWAAASLVFIILLILTVSLFTRARNQREFRLKNDVIGANSLPPPMREHPKLTSSTPPPLPSSRPPINQPKK